MYIFKRKCPWLSIFFLKRMQRSHNYCNNCASYVQKKTEFLWFLLILALLLFVSLILYTFLLYASYFIDLNLCSDGEKERERERERIYYKETDILVFVQSGFMELRKKKWKNYMIIVYFVQHVALEIIFTICKLTTKNRRFEC